MATREMERGQKGRVRLNRKPLGITGRTLVVPLNEGIKATYTMQPDGTLAGEYNRHGNITRGVFRKI